jgi:hypothetical protein
LPSTPPSTIVRKSILPLKKTAPYRGTTPCNKCAEFLELGYDNSLCSLSGRPLANDDNDIDWKTNPFDIDSIDEHGETPEQLMSMNNYLAIVLLLLNTPRRNKRKSENRWMHY